MAVTWTDMAAPFDGQDWRRYDDDGNFRLDVYQAGVGAVLTGTGDTGTDASNLTDCRAWYNLRTTNTESKGEGEMYGVVLRYSSGSFYFATAYIPRGINYQSESFIDQHGANPRIYKYDGSWTRLGEAEMEGPLGSAGGPVSFGARIEGTTIEIWESADAGPPWDGKFRLSADDSSLTSGACGILRREHTFSREWLLIDDFTVEEIS